MMERKEIDLATPSVVTTIPLLQYKPGDLGLVPTAKPSVSPTILQKLGKVSILLLLCIKNQQLSLLYRYRQNLQQNYLQLLLTILIVHTESEKVNYSC